MTSEIDWRSAPPEEYRGRTSDGGKRTWMLTIRDPAQPYIEELCRRTNRDAAFQFAPRDTLTIGIVPYAPECPRELSGPEFLDYFQGILGRLNPLLRKVAS